MSQKRILIVDDDVDFAEAIKVVLEADGYLVSQAMNKQEGMNKIEQMQPDLIIMDVMLERMSDGFDLSRKIKGEDKYKKIPILMLTAIGEKTGFRFSPAAGDEMWLPIDDYAEKPIQPEELISKVKRLLLPRERSG